MTALVLLPGMMCDAGLWQGVLPQLNVTGPVSCGDLSQGESIEEMATMVLDRCPPAFVLLGFSMGGFVAREILRRVPERVKGLALIATSSAADSPMQANFKAAMAGKLRLDSGPFRGLSHRAIKLSLSPRHEDNPQLVQQILDMSLRLGRETWIRQLLMARNSDSHLLSAIRCPTLVVAAAEDRMRSLAESRALCEAIPHAEFRLVEDSGHMLPLEQPQPLAAILTEWITRCIDCR
ncbi:alpha/beta fold hydrolase [Erwiniaceae bacterium CAU 1747]